MPSATDLVTDLPADFEVFGQAVDTSMADLLGGTAGQILAKNTNANMDFVWITNDVGDITAVTAGTGYPAEAHLELFLWHLIMQSETKPSKMRKLERLILLL